MPASKLPFSQLRNLWRPVLTTNDKARTFALAKEIGYKVRAEEITTKPKKR